MPVVCRAITEVTLRPRIAVSCAMTIEPTVERR